MRARHVLAASATLILLVGLVPAGAETEQGLDDPIPGALPTTSFSVTLNTIASGFDSPTSATTAPGVANQLFVTDQTGKIWAVDTSGAGAPKRLFADLSPILVKLGNVVPGSDFDERGLLGLAFDPNYQATGSVFTYQTQPYQRRADFSTEPGVRANCRQYDPVFIAHPCQNVLTKWHVKHPAGPNATIAPGSARELLRVDKPEFNHNGGSLQFGPDGMLYLSVGDGGFGDDQGPGHVPGGNGQSLARRNVLGKILRIDPNGSNSANGKYGIPADNPFVGARGADEIWAYGLRNPWRTSFDTVTGELWVGDTGQGAVEEVDVIQRGGNFGWRLKEGTFLFHPGSPSSPEDGFVTEGDAPGLVEPVAEYDHTGPNDTTNGEAGIGGFVYRGTALPQLAGRYVFGDYSHEFDEGIASGRLFTLDMSADVLHRVQILLVDGADDFDSYLLAFGQDTGGEMYVLTNSTGTLAGGTGVIARIEPA